MIALHVTNNKQATVLKDGENKYDIFQASFYYDFLSNDWSVIDRSVFFFRECVRLYVFVSTSYYESMLDCLVKMLEIF